MAEENFPRPSTDSVRPLGTQSRFALVLLLNRCGEGTSPCADGATICAVVDGRGTDWIWSRDLALGYFSKPPLLAWLIAATTAVCGDGEVCVRLSSPVLHAATACVLFGIGRQLFDDWIGLCR